MAFSNGRAMPVKKVPRLMGAGVLVIIGLALGVGQIGKISRAVDLGPFFAKSEVTIAVTDSGLGGLSIMAEAAARLKDSRVFKSVNLVFFNALFSNDSGYNSLRTREEKIAVFNSALESLAAKYRPDVILVSCNTLSVITGETRFSRTSKIPVLDIVGPGVDMIAEGLKKSPKSAVIILGTETTIAEGEHEKRLTGQGFRQERIITQACPELASYIEKDPKSEDTALLIEAYVDEALAKVKDQSAPILVSLNCTHFGYSLDFWKKAFESRGIKSFAIINPNSKMTDVLVPPAEAKRFAATAVSAKVVSMVEIGRQKIDSLGDWLRKVSQETADALARYELKPDLFEWKRYLKK